MVPVTAADPEYPSAEGVRFGVALSLNLRDCMEREVAYLLPPLLGPRLEWARSTDGSHHLVVADALELGVSYQLRSRHGIGWSIVDVDVDCIHFGKKRQNYNSI